jgi:hypothetical protein
MANRLNIDLKNKTVVILAEYMQGRFKTDRDRAFVVTDGFGTSPSTSGRALLGHWLADGSNDRVEGYMVEKLYEEEA